MHSVTTSSGHRAERALPKIVLTSFVRSTLRRLLNGFDHRVDGSILGTATVFSA